MRQILFRGWDGKKMLAPQDITTNSEYWTWLGKKDAILMQCTGLQDSKGKDIYEGDIIKYKDKNGICWDFIQPVEYDEKHGTLNAGGYLCWEEIARQSEIIGNIYENKEVIEEYY